MSKRLDREGKPKVEWYKKLYHFFVECEPFWVVQYNVNKKPFKRYCPVCGRREQRRNGEWK